MPAKKQSKASPQKNAISDDVLNLQWCVTDRRGLYVCEPGDYNDDKDEYAKGVMTRVGRLQACQWSSVYRVGGVNTNVFKMQVLIAAFTDEKGVEHDEFFKWYAVIEDNFRDFSGDEWRDDNLVDPNDNVCTNIDNELLKKWSTEPKRANGTWFKSWLGGGEGSGAVPASADRGATKPQAPPPAVFGIENQQKKGPKEVGATANVVAASATSKPSRASSATSTTKIGK